MSDVEATSSGGVKSAQRALVILETLARCDGALTFSELEQRTGYPRSSLFGLVKTMIEMSWLDLDERTRRYRLGIRTLEVGNAFLRSVDLVDIVRPKMERIAAAVDETVQLSVLDGRFNAYIAKVEGTQRLRLASEVGNRIEAHATALGKILLAGLDEREVERLFGNRVLERFTATTITDFEQLKREIRESGFRGFATDDEEHTLGVRCFAVPIQDHAGKTIAAISVSFPTVRYTDARGEEARLLLMQAAGQISRELGRV